MEHSLQAGILSLQLDSGYKCHKPFFPPARGTGPSCWRCSSEGNVTHKEGGRWALLLVVDMQVWEPSGKEESLREVANWHRETVLSNILSCFSLSHAIFFHFRFLQVPAIYFSSHKHAVLLFQMQMYLTQEGLPKLAPRLWLGCTSPHLLQNCSDR